MLLYDYPDCLAVLAVICLSVIFLIASDFDIRNPFFAFLFESSFFGARKGCKFLFILMGKDKFVTICPRNFIPGKTHRFLFDGCL